MGLFDWMYEDPSKAADPYLNKIPGTIKPYYEPFIESGKRALPGYERETNRLLNPSQMLSEIGSGYQKSPGFDFAMKQALQGAGHAAAAGGMAGSPEHEFENMDIARNLANKDYQDYLRNALGLYGMGYEGMGGMMKQGFGASSELAGELGSNLASRGQLGYSGAINRNMMNFGTLGQVLGFMKPNQGGMPFSLPMGGG
jgi:hypothetical protein